jgi:hypothetical protein
MRDDHACWFEDACELSNDRQLITSDEEPTRSSVTTTTQKTVVPAVRQDIPVHVGWPPTVWPLPASELRDRFWGAV